MPSPIVGGLVHVRSEILTCPILLVAEDLFPESGGCKLELQLGHMLSDVLT
jgi:hypothetical protein